MQVTPRTFQVLWEASGRKSPVEPFDFGRPIFLRYTDVSEEDVARLAQAGSKTEVKSILKECMKVDQSEGFRTDILADLHYHNYAFCVKAELSPEKTSTFLSIIKVLLEEAVSKRLPEEDAFALFKDWLLKHGVERPPWSVGVFCFEEIKKIMEYVHNTFFRHYRLYMYVYMTHCTVDVRVDDKDLGVVVPPTRPLKLKAAMEVDHKSQPEFAHLFMPSEREQAEATLRSIQNRDKPEDRATIIKRKVDEGVAKLMEKFEEKLKEQDARFQTLMEGK